MTDFTSATAGYRKMTPPPRRRPLHTHPPSLINYSLLLSRHVSQITAPRFIMTLLSVSLHMQHLHSLETEIPTKRNITFSVMYFRSYINISWIICAFTHLGSVALEKWNAICSGFFSLLQKVALNTPCCTIESSLCFVASYSFLGSYAQGLRQPSGCHASSRHHWVANFSNHSGKKPE